MTWPLMIVLMFVTRNPLPDLTPTKVPGSGYLCTITCLDRIRSKMVDAGFEQPHWLAHITFVVKEMIILVLDQ